MKSKHIILTLATTLVFAACSTHEAADTPATAPAAFSFGQPAAATWESTRANVGKTTFNPGDHITITYSNITDGAQANTRTYGMWTDPVIYELYGTISLDLPNPGRVTAEYIPPGGDVPNADGTITYADALYAVSRLNSGITMDVDARQYTVTFTMKHKRARIKLGTVRDSRGQTIPAADIKQIHALVTDGATPPNIVTRVNLTDQYALVPTQTHEPGEYVSGIEIALNYNDIVQTGVIPTTILPATGYTVDVKIGDENATITLEGKIDDWQDTPIMPADTYDRYIYTAEDLAELHGIQGTVIEKINIIQMNDIDLSGIADWTPLIIQYCLYNGNGYEITNLKSTQGGLFNIASNCDLVDIHVAGCEITVTTDNLATVGGIVNSTSSSVISLCSVTGNISVKNGAFVGGLAGYCIAPITRCRAECNITNSSTNTQSATGGLVGNLGGGNIVSSSFTGTITAAGGRSGGIAGQNSGTIFGTFADITACSDQTKGLSSGMGSTIHNSWYNLPNNDNDDDTGYTNSGKFGDANLFATLTTPATIDYVKTVVYGTGNTVEIVEKTFKSENIWANNVKPLIRYNYDGE